MNNTDTPTQLKSFFSLKQFTPFLFFVLIAVAFTVTFPKHLLTTMTEKIVMYSMFALIYSMFIGIVLYIIYVPQLIVNANGIKYRNKPLIDWNDIETIELNGKQPYKFSFSRNSYTEGIKFVQKNGKKIILHDEQFTNLSQIRCFIRDEIILKNGIFPELRKQFSKVTSPETKYSGAIEGIIVNNDIKNPTENNYLPVETPIAQFETGHDINNTDTEWIYFNNDSLKTKTAFSKSGVLNYIFFLVSIYYFFRNTGLVVLAVLALIFSIISICISKILSLFSLKYFGINNSSFCVRNYFSLKNFKHFKKERLFILGNIYEIVFEARRLRHGVIPMLTVVTKSFNSISFANNSLEKEVWWKMQDEFEKRGVKVRVENAALKRDDSSGSFSGAGTVLSNLIAKYKSLPQVPKIILTILVIYWIISFSGLGGLFKKEHNRGYNYCRNMSHGKNVFEELKADSAANNAIKGIGDTFGGGIVAYILQPGDVGYDKNVEHGIIAAPYDQKEAEFGIANDALLCTDTAIGSGLANTDTIVAAERSPNSAARICKSLELGGFKDWYLPSKNELNLIFRNIHKTDVSANCYYWSSTVHTWVSDSLTGEVSNTMDVIFGTGEQKMVSRLGVRNRFHPHVRAVRTF